MLSGYEKYLKTNYESGNTVTAYLGNAGRYLRWCKETYGTEPDVLYRVNIVDFLCYIKTVALFQPGTVNAYINALINFNEYLVHEKIQTEMVVFPSDHMETQPHGFVKDKITVEDFNRMGQAILQSRRKNNKRDYAMFMLLSQAGLRREELVDIYTDDVQPKDHILLVREGKGRKSRYVIINSRTAAALEEYMKVRSSSSRYLFTSRQNVKLSRSRINQILDEYKAGTGIDKKISPHKWRRYNAKRSKEVGVAESDMQNNLGHSNRRTTRGYFDTTVEERVKELDKL